MAALSAIRATPYVNGPQDPQPTGLPNTPGQVHILPVAANVKIYQGALVCLNGGYAAPMTAATGLVAVGYAQQTADNTGGAAAAIKVLVQSGMSAWAQSGGAITSANAGSVVYGVDDQTVTLTSTGASPVGVVDRVDTAGVWVLIDPLSLGLAQGVVVPLTLGGSGATTAAAARTAFGVQSGVTTLVAGVSPSISATITASSRIFVGIKTATPGAGNLTINYSALSADRVVGAPGSFKITALVAAGTINTNDVSVIDWLVVG